MRIRRPQTFRFFLTADDDSETETRGLKAGAMDFLKKPFVPEVLLLCVRHTIDLIRLQTDLSCEVEKQTRLIKAQHEKLDRFIIGKTVMVFLLTHIFSLKSF